MGMTNVQKCDPVWEREMEGEKGRGHSRGRASRLNAAYCHGAQKGECNCDCDADCDW